MSRGAGRGNVAVDSIAEDNKATVLYESGTDLYVCRAVIGAALASEVWQIQYINTATGVVTQWAGGSDSYTNVATDLATVQALSYS